MTIRNNVLMIFMAVMSIFHSCAETNRIKSDGVVTHAKIVDMRIRRGPRTDYQFVYKSKIYFGTEPGYFYILKKGKRCFVRFLQDNPNKSYIIDNILVPDCIDTTEIIWKSIPTCSDSLKFDK
jgi:hypothetical protein